MKIKFTLALSILFLLFAVTAGTAQETRGAIVGQVIDPNGAVVPGATVTITNLETGQKTLLTSNDSGSYSASLLPIGRYRVEAELTGFKHYVRNDIDLRVGDRLQIDIKIELGQVSDSITVTETTPLLQAADASMNQVVDNRRMAELPLAHGNPYHLIALSTGTTFEGDPKLNRPYDPTHIVAYAMDGTRTNTSDITLDGVANTALASSNSSNNSVTAAYVPPTDAIAEVKLQTATFDAKSGQTSGGVVMVSLKSGGNTPHGTAYYNWKSPDMMANDFFANKNNIALADFTYKRIGASFTGPVFIPKVYNGHNKTFFMAAYEHIHDLTPRGQTTTVPTKDERTGDFGELLKLGTAYQIYDPLSRVKLSSGRYQATPYTNNKIPDTAISPVARAVLGYIPLPINGGTTLDHQNNYPTPNQPEDNFYYTFVTRVDHNFSDRHRFFIRADINDRDAVSKDWFKSAASGQDQNYGAKGGALDDVYTFSPTMILNVRYGYSRYVRLTTPAYGRGFDLTSLGFPAALNSAVDPAIREFPYFNIGGMFATNNIGEDRNMDTHTMMAAVTKVKGAHVLDFGFEFRAYRQNRFNLTSQSSGYYDFDSTFTKGPLDNSSASPYTGSQAFASFLLGIPDTKSLMARNASMAEQSTAWMGYVQDSWRASRKLTVTMGVRYELEGPTTERYNRSVTGLDTSTVWSQNAAVQAAYAATYAKTPTLLLAPSALQIRGGVQFAGVNGQPRTLWNSDTNNVAPRVGLAYTANEKTVVRAGYGIFFSPLGLRRGDVLQSGFQKPNTFIPTNDNLAFTTLSNPFPNGILDPTGSSLGIQTEAGNPITFFNPNIQTPYMQRWQLSIQRQLPGQAMLEVAYVGNKGLKLESETATPSTTNQVSISPYKDLNALPNQYLSTSLTKDAANTAANTLMTTNVTNPFLGIAGFGTNTTATTIQQQNLLKMFPQFGAVQTTINNGASWYHALQVRVEKRYSKGVTVNFGYTWSKFMEAIDFLNPADPSPSRALSQQDHTHRATATWIYELPFGRKQPIFSNAPRLADAVIGGWQVQGVYVYQMGAPLTWLDASFYGDPANIATNTRDPNQWFNTGAGFLTSSTLKPMVHLRSWPLRFGSVRNDGVNNWDLAAMKNFSITEGFKINFRAEFLNAMNHARFKAPVTDPFNTSFGQVTDTAGNPRVVQLGFKAVF